jgi:hypothetical protein
VRHAYGRNVVAWCMSTDDGRLIRYQPDPSAIARNGLVIGGESRPDEELEEN